jgi:outer membrane protein OmpA-like peptidoglycan-associated protein
MRWTNKNGFMQVVLVVALALACCSKIRPTATVWARVASGKLGTSTTVGVSNEDADTDKDRIPDRIDKCPFDPETYNRFRDEDGCPDRDESHVYRGPMEIRDKIYFNPNRAAIMRVTYPILDSIASTLKGWPEIRLIELRGHASTL